jgi:hypothetical protein
MVVSACPWRMFYLDDISVYAGNTEIFICNTFCSFMSVANIFNDQQGLTSENLYHEVMTPGIIISIALGSFVTS